MGHENTFVSIYPVYANLFYAYKRILRNSFGFEIHLHLYFPFDHSGTKSNDFENFSILHAFTRKQSFK